MNLAYTLHNDLTFVKGTFGGRAALPRMSMPRTYAPRVAPAPRVQQAPVTAPNRTSTVTHTTVNHYHNDGYGGGGVTSSPFFWMWMMDSNRASPPAVVYQQPAPIVQYQQPVQVPQQGYQDQPTQYIEQPANNHILLWAFVMAALLVGLVWWMRK